MNSQLRGLAAARRPRPAARSGLPGGGPTDGRGDVISGGRSGSVSVCLGSGTISTGGAARSGASAEDSTSRTNSASISSAFACWAPGARDGRPIPSGLLSATRTLETLFERGSRSGSPHARRNRRNQGRPPSATPVTGQRRRNIATKGNSLIGSDQSTFRPRARPPALDEANAAAQSATAASMTIAERRSAADATAPMTTGPISRPA